MKFNKLIALFAILLIFSSCEKDKKEKNIENPSTYTFLRDGASTVSFSGQSDRIAMGEELISAIKDNSNSSEKLVEMYSNKTASGGDANPFSSAELNNSTKSIKSKTAASKDFFSSNTAEAAQIKADFESWINAQATEVFPNFDKIASPGQAGQIADGSSARYVNGKGFEYNQMVNKGLIGALMVDQILNNYLSVSVLDAGSNRAENDNKTVLEGKSYTNMEHKWDEAYGYLFGASSDKEAPLAALGEDSFLNKYLSRVDSDEDFKGIAQNIWNAFKLGRAAIVAGKYDVRDEQAGIIRDLISQVIAVRAVNYLQAGKDALPTSGNDYGSAFHDLSEGFGFVYSLRFTRKGNSSDPYFTKAEVDGFINRLTAGNGLWEVTPATLDEISESIAKKFDFTVAQTK